MYGTLAKIKVKPGAVDELRKLSEQWWTERGSQVPGAHRGYFLQPDNEDDAGYLIAIFDDEATYRANADDPKQNEWFQRFSEHMTAEPEWIDGTFHQ